MSLPEPIAVTLQVVDVLESLGVPYVIGGSMASTLHGMARTTMDSDMVVALQPEHVSTFAAQLQADFYLDVDTINQAIQNRASFNLIHLKTMFKVDIFVAKQRPFDQLQLQRAQPTILAIDPERTARILSAEDIILAKLDWYRLGNEVSERQWRDVISIIHVQGDQLDLDYLRETAVALHVSDLLERALN